MDEVKIIDPQKIDKICIVLVDDKMGFFGWAIKSHCKGLWNHVCILYTKGTVASQDPQGFRSFPINKYMVERYSLKLFSFKRMSGDKEVAILKMINDKLRLPWWKRRYDFIGVFGQAIGCRWLQVPWLSYCSEEVYKYIKIVEPLLSSTLSRRPTPSDINYFCNSCSEAFTYEGHWFND